MLLYSPTVCSIFFWALGVIKSKPEDRVFSQFTVL